MLRTCFSVTTAYFRTISISSSRDANLLCAPRPNNQAVIERSSYTGKSGICERGKVGGRRVDWLECRGQWRELGHGTKLKVWWPAVFWWYKRLQLTISWFRLFPDRQWQQKTLMNKFHKMSPKWTWSGSRDVLKYWQISVNISKTVRDRYTYNGRLIGNHTQPNERHQRQWHWMTLKIIHQLQG